VRFSSPPGIYVHMHTSRLLIALGAFAISGWAQSSAGVAGPVTGFVFDGQLGALRPMLGIPGAAYLGSVVAGGMDAASVAPDGSAALGVQLRGKLMLYSGLRKGQTLALAVSGAIADADHFAWAANSGSAAVYSSRAGQAQILTTLAPTPLAAAPIDLSSLPGQVTALAFDGQHVIVAVASGESGGIYLSGPSAGIQRIASAANPSAIALAGNDLYFADSGAQQIVEVRNYANTPAAVLFANDSGINSPAGLQVSADAQRLYVANAGSRKLVVYQIASRSPEQSLDLAVTPTRLERFGDASAYVVNSGAKEPLYVVRDGGPGKAAVYFVPSPGKPRPLRAPIRPA